MPSVLDEDLKAKGLKVTPLAERDLVKEVTIENAKPLRISIFEKQRAGPVS
jgi:hypothetical protein